MLHKVQLKLTAACGFIRERRSSWLGRMQILLGDFHIWCLNRRSRNVTQSWWQKLLTLWWQREGGGQTINCVEVVSALSCMKELSSCRYHKIPPLSTDCHTGGISPPPTRESWQMTRVTERRGHEQGMAYLLWNVIPFCSKT